MRRLTAIALSLVLLACAEETYLQTQNFDRPVDMATSCYLPGLGEPARAVPSFACNHLRHDIYGFVTNTEVGEIAVFSVTRRQNIDVVDWVPGYTRARVGRMPEVVASHPGGRWVFTANRGSGDMSRLDTRPAPEGRYEVVHQRLPMSPYDLVIGPAPGTAWSPWDRAEPIYETGESAASYQARWADYEDAAIEAAGAVDWVAYVSAPGEQTVLVVPLTESDFGELGGDQLQAISLPGGSPARLALSPDGTTLFVNHLRGGYVSAVDLATGAERKLHLSPACSDGIDNDGDGLTDAADPGCTGRDDEHEGDLERGELCTNGLDDDGDGATDGDDAGCATPPALPACMNGVDDDGDGLTDMDDPGCDRPDDDSEASDQVACAFDTQHPACQGEASSALVQPTSCSNGVDDDGDGLTDMDDPDCLSPLADRERRPACDDGVDNDGDGLTDLDDPGCYSRSGDSETDPQPRELRASAMSPEGDFLYVLDATAFEILVVSWPEGELIDVLGGDLEGSGHPVRRREGRRGIPLGGAPQDIAIIPLDDGGLVAWVSQVSGLTAAVELRHPGLRCPEDGDEDAYRFPPQITQRHRSTSRGNQSSIGQPVLYRGAEEIDLAFAALPAFPSMGPFHVHKRTPADIWGEAPATAEVTCADPDVVLSDPSAPDRPEEPRVWYGVSFPGALRQHRSETWTLRWEGTLPGTERVGRVMDDGGLFHDAGADFCALGVEAGDWLVIRPEERYTCGGTETSPAWEGDLFQWPILEVRADTLRLGSPGQSLVERPEEELEDFRESPYESLSESLPVPTLDCFRGPVAYEVRPHHQYTVTGSLSGYLHNWRNDGGRCVPRSGAEADPRFLGRATESTLLSPLSQCPPSAEEFASNFEGEPFENFVFRVQLYPGCERELDGSIRVLDGQTERDVAWRFTVSAGFTPLQLATGRIPSRLDSLSRPGYRRAFVVDPAGEALFEIKADFDEESIHYTFY